MKYQIILFSKAFKLCVLNGKKLQMQTLRSMKVKVLLDSLHSPKPMGSKHLISELSGLKRVICG